MGEVESLLGEFFNSKTCDKSHGQQKILEANQWLDCSESEKLGSSDP